MRVLDNADRVYGDRPRSDHVAYARQEPIDLFGRIDPFDHHRQVRDDFGQTRYVEPAVGTEASQAAEHRRAGGAFVAQQAQQVFPEWPVTAGGLVLLADVDADALSGAFDVHVATSSFYKGASRARVAPSQTPTKPSRLLPTTYAPAPTHSPPWASVSASQVQLLKVV